MVSPGDRIRRVLGDGPPALSAPAARGGRIPADLRSRLEALGVGRGSSGAALPETPPTARGPSDASDGRTLEEIVEGEERRTPHGAFLFLERRLPLDRPHGDAPLAQALRHPVPLRDHERGPGGAPVLDAREAVFFDTETTGLSGGTGTVAFLVGAGRVEGRDFVVRQYCMRDFPEEAALLHALLDDLGSAPLVTFNGRSFDWPLLCTRLRLHRMEERPRTHLDLLPPARRLWSGSLSSHALGTLEERVLGLRRVDDLPGALIPQAWFEYLRTGRGARVALAFRHNEIDVVSMLALMGRVGAILADPAARTAPPRDHLGTARLLLDLGHAAAARRCLEAALAASAPQGEAQVRRALGHVCRRQGDHGEALAHFQRLARGSARFEAEAWVEAAKILEHRLRDPRRALGWVGEALARVPADSPAQRGLRHREARLTRRLARLPTNS